MLTTVLISAIYCAVCVLVYFYTDKKDSADNALNRGAVIFVLLAAAAVRVFFALQDYSFTYDTNCFKAWGSYANSLGFKNLYSGEFFLDYPPGYMYILALANGIINLLGLDINGVGATFVIKLPSMLADFGIALLIYRFAQNRGLGRNKAFFAAGMFLFMPSVIFNSAVWGQIESWYMLFILLALCFATENRTVFAAVAYAAALITKPQAIMFGPLFLFYIIRRKSVKELLKSVGTGLGTVYLIALPFCKNPLGIGWLADLYTNTVSGYKYFTVNAFNLHYLAKLNWVQLPDSPLVSLITPAVIAASVVMAAYIFFSHKNYDGFFAAGCVIISLIFALCTMMHERYLWPAAVLCVFAYIASGKKQYLCFGALFGCLCYINSSWVMAMYYQTFDLSTAAERAVSLVCVAVTAAFAGFALYLAAKEKTISMKTLKSLLKPHILVGIVTVLYTFVALWNLGSTRAPQTYFIATDSDYMFTVEFDSPVNLGSIYTYSGLGDQFAQPEGQKLLGEFEIATSADGANFDVQCDIGDMSVYTWKETLLPADAVKAVRVRAKYVGNVLHEIAFFDTTGNLLQGRLVPAADSANPYGAALAYDEQDAVPKDTSYFGSMYFDEIYHGRTAYEQLEGYQIYETTHPPLGKILISIGVALFGMTPFGWRIVGAVCGAFMIPVIYLLIVALCRNKWAGFAGAALLALDFMHLTQTRIATVDTYVVLFVLLTFLFMAHWHNTPWGDRKGWLCLALSGAFMGCAVASKWNGAYPMVALAVLFFISFAGKYLGSGKTAADKKLAARTIALCFVFFVAVPAAIYTASFIPVIKADGFADYIRQFANYQKHMYDYHANLVAEHFFSSMWYTWPVCLKPIWYAISDVGTAASSISAFGNPAIWALTPFAALYCIFKGVKSRQTSYLFAGLGWLSSYLPWVMVTRLCFIYHYFPCAVFGIVAIALAIRDICRARPQLKKAVGVYLAVCLVLFVMFLPVTTGMPVAKEYLDFLEFLPQWHFVNI
ncbi:MAG: glycosyltransferase family 39 protein [Oscillospiraceae bacterium]|nr:glycosyltransferase family 39 protein [Oscillospiraceae bacterium]